jgi:3-deoxy-D-manno-octulosonic acid hydroxylase-like protein
MTSQVVPLEHAGRAPACLEAGNVVWQRDGFFTVTTAEAPLYSPSVLTSGKNVSFDPATGRVGRSSLTGPMAEALRGMLSRFSAEADAFVRATCPEYASQLVRGRASFRPVEIAGRASSWRKDDTRLHVDAFPATPVQGRRILRVFVNVNPHGHPRSWRIGDSFDAVSRYFAPKLRLPWPGTSAVLRTLRITRTPRSAYDSLMLQLHDRMKQDTGYQQSAPQTAFDFPPGSAWMVFTDAVSHAAMAGQYQLEQTFLLPVGAMIDEHQAPLRILERLNGRRLA